MENFIPRSFKQEQNQIINSQKRTEKTIIKLTGKNLTKTTIPEEKTYT